MLQLLRHEGKETVLKKLCYIGLLGVCLVAVLNTQRVVWAHVFLKSAKPEPDLVVAQAPSQVVLVFSGDLAMTGNQITVTDASGNHFETGSAVVNPDDHTTVSIGLKPLSSGVYTVNYQVTSSADGHETSDNYRFGVGNVTVTPNVPSRACAMLPAISDQAKGANASVRIVSPADNTTLTSSHLDYTIETKNFNLGSNGNYADVWVDGQKVQKIESIGGHSLELTSGIHDVCIALVDGTSGTEVGARVGIRLSVSNGSAAQGQNGLSLGAIMLAITVSVGVFVAIIFLVYRRRNSQELPPSSR